jgi:4-hydroxybenzoate polyprenyltransferase
MKPNSGTLHKFSTIRLWARALRLHQWAKNTLIFVPLILGGGGTALSDIKNVLLGFFLLSITASATYVVNDLLDLESDRLHPTKRMRPFASGQLSVRSGIIAVIVLAGIVALLVRGMPVKFDMVVAAYTALTLLYSFFLKREAIIDVLTIAVLFTLRIGAGMMFLTSPASYWLLLFSFFFFLSLALVKRYSELHDLAEANGHKVSGRVYVITDRPFIMSAGLASAFAGCLVFVIYIANENFPHNIYSNFQWLWAICGILVYWLVRIWFLASRGLMNQDPILFALKDRASLAMGLMTILCVALAW